MKWYDLMKKGNFVKKAVKSRFLMHAESVGEIPKKIELDSHAIE